MNFWQFLMQMLTCIIDRLNTHGTRYLGLAVGTLTVLTSSGVVQQNHLKYYLVAIAVLTYWRGATNADRVATKVADKMMADIAPLAQSTEKLK